MKFVQPGRVSCCVLFPAVSCRNSAVWVTVHPGCSTLLFQFQGCFSSHRWCHLGGHLDGCAPSVLCIWWSVISPLSASLLLAEADILIAAMGKAEYVTGDWVKPGAAVIDVGINAVNDPSAKKGYRWAGADALVVDRLVGAVRYVGRSSKRPLPCHQQHHTPYRVPGQRHEAWCSLLGGKCRADESRCMERHTSVIM